MSPLEALIEALKRQIPELVYIRSAGDRNGLDNVEVHVGHNRFALGFSLETGFGITKMSENPREDFVKAKHTFVSESIGEAFEHFVAISGHTS